MKILHHNQDIENTLNFNFDKNPSNLVRKILRMDQNGPNKSIRSDNQFWNDDLGNSMSKSKVRWFSPYLRINPFWTVHWIYRTSNWSAPFYFKKQIFRIVTGQWIEKGIQGPSSHGTDWSELIVRGSLGQENGRNSPNSWTKIVAVSILSCFLFLACSDKIFSIFWISLIFKFSNFFIF